MYKLLFSLGLFLLPFFGSSQIIIALLLGDKLQSDKMEFGLSAGINSSKLTQLEFSRYMGRLKFGLYFDFKLNDRLVLSPELVLVSGYGHQNVPFYTTGDSTLDVNLQNSSINRELNYWTVPLTLRIKTIGYLYVNVGGQFSLRKTSHDLYLQDFKDGTIAYERDITPALNTMDMGPMIGLSWKLMKGKGVGLNLNYYHGMTNLNTGGLPGGEFNNSSLQIFANVPIGQKPKTEKPVE